MKQMKLLLIVPICLVMFSSCKKKIWGCMDITAENYSPVATEDAQDCTYADSDEVFSSTVNGASWTLVGGVQWQSTISWAAISSSVIDKGGVLAFISVSDGSTWEQIPMTFYQTDTYSTSIGVSYTLGEATITWTDSDLTEPITPPTVDIKLIILK
jgi:hypothetical protein